MEVTMMNEDPNDLINYDDEDVEAAFIDIV